MSQHEETLVGKIIHEKIPIEWMRYNMFLTNNKYKSIPMLVFRVQDSCSNSLIEDLKKSVNDFNGKLRWKVFKNPLTRKDNFGEERYKKYCDDAIQDIPMLAKHIAETL